MSKYNKSFIIVFISNFLTKTVGFIKDLLFGWTFGATTLLDNYFLITSIPNIINSTWNKALETVLLPIHADNSNKYGELKANQILSQLSFILSLISLVVYIIIVIIGSIALKYLYISTFTHIIPIAISIVCFAIIIETFLLSLKIHKLSHKKFLLIQILPFFQSFVLILAILFFRTSLNLTYLSLFYILGTSIQLLVTINLKWIWSNIKVYTRKLLIEVKSVIKNSMLLSMAAGIGMLNVFVDQTFALRLSEGSITYIHYGSFFLTIFQILIVQNFNTILFPSFQEYVQSKNIEAIKGDCQKFVKFVLLICLLSWILMLNNGYFLVHFLLSRGEMTVDSIKIIYFCVLGYGLAFLGTSINGIIIRIFHVFSEFKFLFRLSFINFFINIILNFIFIYLFGIWGIALSTSITILFLNIIHFLYLDKKLFLKIIEFSDRWYLRFFLLFLTCTFVEFIIIKYAINIYSTNLADNILLIIISVFSFVLLTVIFKFIMFRDGKLVLVF